MFDDSFPPPRDDELFVISSDLILDTADESPFTIITDGLNPSPVMPLPEEPFPVYVPSLNIPDTTDF